MAHLHHQSGSPASSTSRSDGGDDSTGMIDNWYESNMDEEEFQQSLELLIKNPKKRKATEKKAGKEDAGHDVDASGKKKMKKMTAPRSPK